LLDYSSARSITHRRAVLKKSYSSTNDAGQNTSQAGQSMSSTKKSGNLID
jgi:hypothetical protein